MAARDERATSGEYIEPGEITALAQRADVIGNVATFDRGVDRPAEQGNRERDADCRSQRGEHADQTPARARSLDCKNGEGCDTTAHTCTVTGGSGQICSPGATCNSGLLCIDEGGPFGPVAVGALKTWAAPVSNDQLTLAFKQSIGATESLRTGAYGKTLTFTLSTTSP